MERKRQVHPAVIAFLVPRDDVIEERAPVSTEGQNIKLLFYPIY